jgi:hypothetical protein
MTLATVAICLLAAGAAAAEDERVAKFAKAYRTQLGRETDNAKSQMANARDKKGRAEAKKRLNDLQKGTAEFWPTMAANEVGQIGLVAGDAKVLSIVDERNMLVMVTTTVMVPHIRGTQMKGEPIRMRPKQSSHTLWIRGIETGDYADGSAVELPDLMEVTGTEKYANVGGAQPRVFVIERFDVKRLEPYLKSGKPKK